MIAVGLQKEIRNLAAQLKQAPGGNTVKYAINCSSTALRVPWFTKWVSSGRSRAAFKRAASPLDNVSRPENLKHLSKNDGQREEVRSEAAYN
jgi:hypothetical protein